MEKGSQHTEESKRKISESQQGKHHSEEAKAKIRKARIGTHHSKKTKRKISKSKKGKPYPEKACKRRSKARKGKGNPFYGKHHSEETIAKMSESRKRENLSEETIEKMRQVAKNRYCSKETRAKLSRITKKHWQDPEYREKTLRAISKGLNRKPTKPERRLKNRLNHLFPGEYKFVGNGIFWIGSKNPDFVNINSQKKIIEMFGDYWHSKEVTGRTKYQEENRRIKHFVQYGFKTLIVWQNELKDIKQLRAKLIEFHNI